MSEKLWKKITKNQIKAGTIPFPLNDNSINLMKILITEEQVKFLEIFRRSSMRMDELMKRTDIGEDEIEKELNDLMNIGVVTGIPSRTTGVMVYRLSPFYPGLLEYTLMRGETGEKQKKIAQAWDKIFKDMNQKTQQNYDIMFKDGAKIPDIPTQDHVIPIEKEIEFQEEIVLSYETITKILDDNDTIAVGHCYCRHRKALLGESCEKKVPKQACFYFDRVARFTIEHNFAREVSKEEARKILEDSEDAGLIHKAVHNHLKIEEEMVGLCNCCPCCCGIFAGYRSGTFPIITYTTSLASVEDEKCVGCGTCVETCIIKAIQLEDSIAIVNENICFGCGACAHKCPEKAIKLKIIEPRKVFVPPQKIKQD